MTTFDLPKKNDFITVSRDILYKCCYMASKTIEQIPQFKELSDAITNINDSITFDMDHYYGGIQTLKINIKTTTERIQELKIKYNINIHERTPSYDNILADGGIHCMKSSIVTSAHFSNYEEKDNQGKIQRVYPGTAYTFNEHDCILVIHVIKEKIEENTTKIFEIISDFAQEVKHC